MAERRYVKCVKCSDTIDKRDDFGWVKNESSGRYTCAACSRGYINGGRTSTQRKKSSYKAGSVNTMPSAKTYKVSGTIAKYVGIFVLVMSVLLLFALPPIGIFFAVLGVLFVFSGNSYLKKAKAMSEDQEDIEESI